MCYPPISHRFKGKANHHPYSKHRIKIPSLLVYGGSFDPIHLGHIRGVQIALKILNPSLCFITPAFRNPFKSQIKYSPQQRIKWIKRSMQQNIKDKRVKLCLFEIKRQTPTPTITTIQYLRKSYNISKIYFLLGADNAKDLHTWDEFALLNELVEFVFLERESYTAPKSYRSLPLHIPVSSTQIRNGEQKEFLPPFLQALR